ncbi:hypothetical protein C1645_837850 [Glomus cerebriforme]|uniref:Uncharacterized protein n=1 Tax=Glomus cerebriforme TaxID=658196 RepID=A0A397SER2_9GLOM|nr:hypothetical protein C1645_837850 [Glomus cerebriforme]
MKDNIVNEIIFFNAKSNDLGLCKPANETYVAPEKKIYTRIESDVHRYRIVIYKVLEALFLFVYEKLLWRSN